MILELHKKMMDSLDYLAEFEPPEALNQIGLYTADQYSAQDWNRLNYIKGKAMFTMRRINEAEEIALECIRESIAERDYFVMVKSHYLQAVCYYGTDMEDRVKPLLEITMEYAIESDDLELLIDAHCAYAYFFRKQSQFEQALKHGFRIADLIHRVPASYTTASAYASVAAIYVDKCNWDAAIEYYVQALEQAQTLSLAKFQLRNLNNLGSALCRINDFYKAEKILNQGLKLAQQMGIRHQEFLFLSNLGNMKIQDEKYQEAIEYYDMGMKLMENVPQKPPLLLIDTYNNYSMCYWKLKNPEKSFHYIDEAIKIAQEFGFERDLIQMEVNKTNLLVEIGELDEALLMVKRGAKYYAKAKDLHQMMWVHRVMAHIYYLKKEYKKSHDTVLKLHDITEEYITEIQRKEVTQDIAKIKVSDASSSDYSTLTPTKAKIEIYHGFVGCSKAYHKVLNSALLAAQHQNTSVMILGESGTGKEIIAQIIHRNSLRRNQTFAPVNVGALSASLVESELFGHTKGAYTGADTATKGFFLEADKGTLFLDEITDMPLTAQSKLLRALETRKVIAVGSSKETAFDSRIISATSQDIRAKLSDNQFRLDLFHRLNTIEIVIPPLRERQEDIEPILKHYVKYYSTELSKSMPIIDKSLIEMLSTYHFPGNVRELKNIVERMYILSNNKHWNAELLSDINPFSFGQDGLNPKTANNEEETILKALIKAKGIQKEAASLLNMSEATLYRRIQKYKLQQYTRKRS